MSEPAYELHGMKPRDPCPQCDGGELAETDFGLSCDNCEFDEVDPRKFPKEEADSGDLSP